MALADYRFANFARTTLATAMDATQTTLAPVAPAKLSSTARYHLLVDQELVLVTAGAGTASLTVTRAQGGTAAATHIAGAAVAQVLTAEVLDAIRDEMAAGAAPHATRHAAGGSDVVTPGAIKALTAIPFHMTGTASVWTNMPAALTEMFGDPKRHMLDMAAYTQARLIVYVSTSGVAGSVLRAQYWDGAAWQYLATTAPEVSLVVTPQGQMSYGAWAPLVAGAKSAEREVRIVGLNGDGVVDPVLTNVFLYLR